MHRYVHWGTVYNSKDLEPTQMPINNRLDKENMAHICHGIPCIHKRGWVYVLFRDMMNPETIILSKLTQEQKTRHHMFSLIGGCWTKRTYGHREGNITHWGLLWGGQGRDSRGWGGWGGVTWGEMPDIGDGENGGSKPHCCICTYATILHFLYMYPRT